MSQKFVAIPSAYPKLLELRKSKTAALKPNPYIRESTVLRYYQVVGALHMMLLNRMVLGDSTGLGKTIQGITSYSFLYCDNQSLKLLIVCPKSAMFQWAEEIDKFTTGFKVRVVTNEYVLPSGKITGFKARSEQYKRFKANNEHIMIINYDPLREEYEMVSDSLGPNFMLILDEVTAVKNRKSKIHFACGMIAQRASRAYGLSATIIKNGLEEVFGIYAVVVPGLFGNITSFVKTYCQTKLIDIYHGGKKRKIPKIVGYKNLQQFRQLIDPYFLIRKKEEVASELPKLISKKITLEMTEDQRKAYIEALEGVVYEDRVKKEFFEIVDLMRSRPLTEAEQKKYAECKDKYEKFLSPEGKKRGKLAALTYCQMVSNGPALIGKSGESSKEVEFERLMSEELTNEKVILFTRFKSGIPFLEVICERLKIKYVRITGDESSAERDQARIKFQTNPEYKLIFITTAGTAALNLQTASTIIFFDTPWSYGDLVQTIGRAQRIGSLQDHILLIHFVNKSTIDVRVMNLVTSKKDLSDEILGATAEGALDFAAHEESVIDDLYSDLISDAKELARDK